MANLFEGKIGINRQQTTKGPDVTGNKLNRLYGVDNVEQEKEIEVEDDNDNDDDDKKIKIPVKRRITVTRLPLDDVKVPEQPPESKI